MEERGTHLAFDEEPDAISLFCVDMGQLCVQFDIRD
jgi:hypothetical protein